MVELVIGLVFGLPSMPLDRLPRLKKQQAAATIPSRS